ncbi:MAG: PTS sugar transporter subunit IIA [Spirochaetes bacterium]|nr:MAG: PTS sugar transporter subunit IIA [Spirochaetota bacterium]RKY03470.1 MAG: PTS sugar transporter subunit IIA [Spirochaetota bacterium]
MTISLHEYISLNRIFFSTKETKQEVIDELVNVSIEDNMVKDLKTFKEALLKRESIMSTGIGYGVAIPHVKLPQIEDFFITICIHKKGVDWGSLDNKPAYLIFLIAGPDNQQEKYLRILAKLTLVIKNPERRKKLMESETKYEVFEIFREF